MLSSLKYFFENKPELHLVVAGCLLGVMNMKGESFPVGKVDILHLYPMTYEEFLLANDEKPLLELLKSGDKTLINSLAPKFTEYLRQYYFVGGMPEAVLHFTKGHDPMETRNIQQNILTAYEADISKHTGGFYPKSKNGVAIHPCPTGTEEQEVYLWRHKERSQSEGLRDCHPMVDRRRTCA